VARIKGGNVIAGAGFGRDTITFEYDFAVDGGAVSSIPLRAVGGDDAALPAGAIIDAVTVEVLTILGSGGAATVGITTEGAVDTVAQTAFGSAPWSTTGRKNGIPQDGATSIKTTAVRTPVAVVAGAALNAGKFRVHLTFIDTSV